MNETNPFVISQFTNPSGEIVFRVEGHLDGRRVRRNFHSRAEADAAFLHLKGAALSLLEYLECGLANYRGAQQQKALARLCPNICGSNAPSIGRTCAAAIRSRTRTISSGRFMRGVKNWAVPSCSSINLL